MNTFSRAARSLGVLPLLGAMLLLSGCGAGDVVSTVRQIARTRQQLQQIQQQSGALPVADVTTGETTPLAPDEAVIQLALDQNDALPKIAPTNSGPGLVVCEPVVAGDAVAGSTPNASAAAFGVGCGRWLHFAASGLPQLGKTPSWFALDYALREMGKSDGRIDAKKAAQLAKILAVSHIAIGELIESEAGSTLTYRLWKMPEKMQVGAPIVLRGNRAQIAAGLPGVAKNLSTRLKANSSLVPAKVESEKELEAIGAAPRHTEFSLDATTAQKLKALAARSPLASMEYLAHLKAVVEEDDDALAVKAAEDAARRLLQQTPQNTLALGQVSIAAGTVLEKSSVLKNLDVSFPNNYLVIYAQSVQASMSQDRVLQKQLAQRAIAAAPKSAWAWLQLETALSGEADDVRKGRYSSRMSNAEHRFVGAIYPQMLAASLQAARCDPLNADAWQRASYAAAADSRDDVAEAAFWKSMSLPARSDGEYWWGLELFQPKWQGDAEKLRLVARMDAADNARFVRVYWDIVEAFQDAGRRAEAKQWENKAVQALSQWLRDHPADGERRSDYGHLLKSRGDYANANAQFQILIQKQPEDDDGYEGLALVCEEQRDWKGAAKNYEKVIELNPKSAFALFRGGQSYHQTHQMAGYKKAEAMYRKAIALAPKYADPYNRLADLYFFVKHDKKGAERLYRKAIALDPNDEMFQTNLERCLAS